MQGFKTDIHTVKRLADTRPGWDYAPAWLSPAGEWCLPVDANNDHYHTTSHAAFRVGDKAGYEYNWTKGYARVEFPRAGRRLQVEKGRTPVRRLPPHADQGAEGGGGRGHPACPAVRRASARCLLPGSRQGAGAPDVSLSEYLSEPCDEKGCERTADHNQAGRKVCNRHLDNSPTAPRAFARND